MEVVLPAASICCKLCCHAANHAENGAEEGIPYSAYAGPVYIGKH